MLKKAMVVLSLISVSGAAFSSTPVANIKVTGSITPPTCKINGQNEVDLEYKFDIDRNSLPDTGSKQLDEEITKNIEIICDATTYLALTPIDQRVSSIADPSPNRFGLGFFGEGGKIGYYNIILHNLTVKADEASALQKAQATGPIFSGAGIPLNNSDRYAWSTSGDSKKLQEGKIFSADLTVSPVVESSFKSSWSDEKLDGHVVLAFSFSL